jgi:hypothetical protein
MAHGGETRTGYGAINRGNLPDRPGEVQLYGGGAVDSERALREAMRDLNQLRQQLGANSDVGKEISDMIHDLQHGSSEYALAGPALNERIEREVLPAIEQLEMQLRRKVDGDNATVRNPAADQVPAGYSEKVAEYFRKLSKTK